MLYFCSSFEIFYNAPSESSTKFVANFEVTSVFSRGVHEEMNSTQFLAFSTKV